MICFHVHSLHAFNKSVPKAEFLDIVRLSVWDLIHVHGYTGAPTEDLNAVIKCYTPKTPIKIFCMVTQIIKKYRVLVSC